MITLSAKDFDEKYGGVSNRIDEAQKSRFFNVGGAKDVFSQAASDINLAREFDSQITPDKRGMGAGKTATTAILQGGLAPFRAVGAGVFGTETAQKATGAVIDKMTKLGEAITPESVLDYVGKQAQNVIEGYEAMSPQEQLDQRNKLAIAEVLSYYAGGAGAKEAVVAPAVRGAETMATTAKESFKSTPKSAEAALREGQKLRTQVQEYVGKTSVDPQVQASAERLAPQLLKGTAVRTENIVQKYDSYLKQSERAIEDIKADPAIAEVGEKMGDAFDRIIKERRAIGAQLGDELKAVGGLKVSIKQSVDDLLAELKDSGASYNPRTRELVTPTGSRFAEGELDMLNQFINRVKLLGEAPTVRDIDNFIAKTRSELAFSKGSAGVLGTTNAERLINSGIASLKEALNPAKNGIVQLDKYWKVNKTYSQLSDFVEEGSKYLGKVTQSGDYAKDASVAKSAVQSILNNGKKDWMLKLEALTGYNALDDAVLALQAMKDAGDYRGLSLLQAMKESGIPTSKAGITGVILDKAVDLGKQVVAGSPAEQTRAFLAGLSKKAAKDLKVPDKKVMAPKGTPKTKEITALEKEIAKNVDSQKVAIKKGDFELVAKLKTVYEKLVTKLKELVKFAKENAGDTSGKIKNPFYKGKNPNISPDDRSVMEGYIDAVRLDKDINNNQSKLVDRILERLEISPDLSEVKIANLLEDYLTGKRDSSALTKTGRPFKNETKTTDKKSNQQ